MVMYIVKYNFHAEEEGELSVKKGETVRVLSVDGDAKDGWILVEQLVHPFRRGYVPGTYVKKTDTYEPPMVSPVKSFQSPPNGNLVSESPKSYSSARSGQRSPTKSSRNSLIRRLSDPRLSQHLVETMEIPDSDEDVKSHPSRGVSPSGSQRRSARKSMGSVRSAKSVDDRFSTIDYDSSIDASRLLSQLEKARSEYDRARDERLSDIEHHNTTLLSAIEQGTMRLNEISASVIDLQNILEEQLRATRSDIQVS